MARYIQSAEREKPVTENTLLTRLPFRMEGEIKNFTDKHELRGFATKPYRKC